MIEKGIKEEDVKGMNKADIVKNIVQSNYTWMVKFTLLKFIINLHIYIFIQPPKQEISRKGNPTTTGTLSNFEMLTSRFQDISDDLPLTNKVAENSSDLYAVPVKQTPKKTAPPPPPRKPKNLHLSTKMEIRKENVVQTPKTSHYSPLARYTLIQ